MRSRRRPAGASAVRTLTYHDVVARDRREQVGFAGALAARYKLEPDLFERHLEALAATDLQVRPLDAGAPPSALTLTFDDGGGSGIEVAGVLERRGWRGQFFVTTGRLDSPGFLSSEQVAELARRGHLIGSHSHTHPTYMGRLAKQQLEFEWTESRALLAQILGEPPRTASVPGGYLSPRVIETAADAGYELLFTSEPTARVRTARLVVRGRYTIWATTAAAAAAGYARGDPLACGRLWLEWNAKKLAKRINPSAYQALRRVRARKR